MWFVFSILFLCQHVSANVGDVMTETIQRCCNDGSLFASTRSEGDCSADQPLPSDIPSYLGSLCIIARAQCCKEYFQKKKFCEIGIDYSTSTNRCDVSDESSKVCCKECARGTAAGLSQGASACISRPQTTGAVEILSDKAFVQCCMQAAKESGSSHSSANTVTVSKKHEVPASVCEDFAPNELCAHHCIPIPGSYKCECNPGFMLMADGRNCKEVVKNRCKPRNPCQHKCNDNGVEVLCSCRRGYELMPDGKSCQDIDECQLDIPVCLPGTKCTNIQGSYRCIPQKDTPGKGQCPPGFARNINNNACDDINECKLPNPPCPAYICENTVGGYKCGGMLGDPVNLGSTHRPQVEDRCPPGFALGIHGECEDIDECSVGKDDCNHLSQFCINTQSSFYCQDKVSKHCPPGFKINTATSKCEDINECEEDSEICADQICVNQLGAYDCKQKPDRRRLQQQCPDGMRKNPTNFRCEDIDECVEGTHLCDQHQNCLNTNGSFECHCKLGYELDRATGACVDINECATGQHDCISGSQRCDNTVGSFLCIRITSCGTGYILHHSTGKCEDVDECALGTHNCARAGSEYQCMNIPGSFRCVKKRVSTTTLSPDYEYVYYDSDEETEINENTVKSESPVPSSSTAAPSSTTEETRSITEERPEIPVTPLPEPKYEEPTKSQLEPVQPETKPAIIYNEAKQTPEETPDSTYYETRSEIPDQSERPDERFERPDQRPERPEERFERPEERPERPEERPETPEERPVRPEERSKRPEERPERPEQRPESPDFRYDYNRPESRPEYNRPEETPQAPEPVPTEPRPREDHERPVPTYSPYQPTPKQTPPPYIYVSVGQDQATVVGKQSEDGLVLIDTKEVPKNRWTKIDVKPPDCLSGFETNDYGGCFDIDECATNRHSCSGFTEICRNTIGGYLCDCAPGFRRDLVTGACDLIITTSSSTSTLRPPPPFPSIPPLPETTPSPPETFPPQPETTPAPPDTPPPPPPPPITTPTPVSSSSQGGRSLFWGYPDDRPLSTRPFIPRSKCDAGYHFNSKADRCEDIDECTNGQANCAAVEICVNTQGGYRCECPPNWRLDEVRHRCMPIRHKGVFPPGYGNVPVHPVENKPYKTIVPDRGSDPVSPEITQIQDRGTVLKCPWGYRLGDDYNCVDVDECVTGEARCGPIQICTNLPGGYSCGCPPGHRLVGDHECEDVDECSMAGNTSICSEHADCVNTIGSYICKCRTGFRPAPYNDKVCMDVDECAESRPGALCQHRCSNVWGSYACFCHRGYRLNPDNRTCSDVDECVQFKAKIPCVGKCLNEPGSYRCSCPPGYRLSEDKRSCIDIDECEVGEATCQTGMVGGTSHFCFNTRGSYRCHKITCPPGYQLENKHRCSKTERVCRPGDWECAHQPTTISYNFITFVSKLYVPESNVKLFTMRGPAWPYAKMKFELRLVDVNAPPSVKDRADINAFLLIQNDNEAVMSLVRPLEGPQSIELELSMELYSRDQFGGIALAKLFIHVSEYEF